MASKLSGSTLSEVKNIAEFATAATRILTTVAGGESSNEKDSSFFSTLGSIFGFEDDSKSQAEEEFVSTEDIRAFQTGCVEAFRRSAEETGKSEDSRFVVFVDGLDYIDPGNAIELLEQIKTYIECPRCVFVLAIDEVTMLEGAKKKLGDKADENSKKMLFDRFVQVPLRIPTSAYKLDKYIEGLLKDE